MMVKKPQLKPHKKEKLIGFEPMHNEDDKIQYYQDIVPNSFNMMLSLKQLQKGYHNVKPEMFMRNTEI